MNRSTWLMAGAGVGALVLATLTSGSAQASQAGAPGAVSARTASLVAAGDLAATSLPAGKSRRSSSRGRGGDGYGGENGGGSSRYKASKHGSKHGSKHRKHRHHHNNGGHNNGGGQNGGGHGGGPGCHYPPSRSPQVTLAGPRHTHKGRTVTLTGKVTSNGCGVATVKLGLYSSHDGKTEWRMIRAGAIDARGNFSFSVPSWRLHYYQAVVAAGNGYSMASSAILPLPLR